MLLCLRDHVTLHLPRRTVMPTDERKLHHRLHPLRDTPHFVEDSNRQ